MKLKESATSLSSAKPHELLNLKINSLQDSPVSNSTGQLKGKLNLTAMYSIWICVCLKLEKACILFT